MIKLKGIFGIFLLSTIFIFFNSTVYADPGQGQGGGNRGSHGQGKNQKQHNARSHGTGRGLGHKKARAVGHSSKNATQANTKNIQFARKDRTTIVNYFKATPFQGATLPPGIAMNLLRGKPLPPGIAKVYLPQNLVRTLPVYPGYEYLAVGPDVVLANTTTGIIADVLTNVLK